MGKHPEAAATAAEPAPGVAAASPRGEAGGREDDPLLYRRRFGTTGFQHAGPMSKATYAFVDPLIKLGWHNKAGGGCGLPGCGGAWHVVCLLRVMHACMSRMHVCAWQTLASLAAHRGSQQAVAASQLAPIARRPSFRSCAADWRGQRGSVPAAGRHGAGAGGAF